MAADSDFAVLPTTILRMYDSFGHFKLAEMMGTTGCLKSLERKMRPMQKLESNNDDSNTLQKYEMEVEELRRGSVNMEAEIILPGIFVKSLLMIAYGGVDVAVGTADVANIVIYPKTGEMGETEWELAIVHWNVGAVKILAGLRALKKRR
ncbi:hypothetical protein N7530_008160 [Penicillium desertorum]|uniref:Uncharacterized protein n=1 Tax=Penicillium desertorum TaxID=1303715 RepID=A0A9W9WNM6_9EURO|nr:hypothetical protein N7530_008160 [Penicillium desertorum]